MIVIINQVIYFTNIVIFKKKTEKQNNYTFS